MATSVICEVLNHFSSHRMPTQDNLISTWIRRLGVACRQLVRELFEEEGLDAVFSHVRNMLVATLVVSAGIFGAERHEGSLHSVVDAWYVGYTVAGIGLVLVLLNLADGLRRLSGRRHHVVLRVTLLAIYLVVSVRVAQMLLIFRSS